MAIGAAGGAAGIGGIFGTVSSIRNLFNDPVDPIIGRGQARGVSREFSDLLLERLGTEPADTRSFASMSAAIREALQGRSAASRQRLSDVATQGGFFDSGSRIDALQNIDRAELQTFGQEIRQLLENLEERRTRGVLPFLGIATRENLGVASLEEQSRQGTAGSLMGQSSSFFS